MDRKRKLEAVDVDVDEEVKHPDIQLENANNTTNNNETTGNVIVERSECNYCNRKYIPKTFAKHVANCKIKLRTEELTNLLNEYGCKLRSDSRLCSDYIKNGGDVNYVVRTMIEMNFYFNFTNYADEYDRYCEDERRYRGRYDPDDVWMCHILQNIVH